MFTLIIFDECDGCLKLFKIEGDHRKFNDIYINDSLNDESPEKAALESELHLLIYNQADGSFNHEDIELEEFREEARDFRNAIIIAGFYP